jgi:hypothetical protein
MLQLDGIKLKDLEAGFMSRQHKFALFYPDGKSVWFILELKYNFFKYTQKSK